MPDVVITGKAAVRPDLATGAADPDGSTAYRVGDFDPQARFGRRVTRFNNRSTLLAMAACEAAVADAGLAIDEASRNRIGITVGTTLGSLSGIVEFGEGTFDRDRPYLVNAACFPNAVLNTAAGALAIRMDARGANATVAAGPLAGIAALRYGEITLRAGHIDTMLAGASEEATAPAVVWARSARATGTPGEGAAMFVLEREDAARAAGRTPIARLAATVSRAVDPADTAALADVVSEALERAGLAPYAVESAAARATGVPAVDDAQRKVLEGLPASRPLWSEDVQGDAYNAHSALQLAEMIDRLRQQAAPPEHRHRGPDAAAPRAGLVVATDPEGAVGVAVVTVGFGPPA